MFAIFIMNAAIGIKICHYTGRDTFDRFSDVIGRPVATGNNDPGGPCGGGAGGGPTTGGEAHQIEHGGSPGENDQHTRRQLQQTGSHHQQRYNHHHHSHHHHHHHPGCPNDLIYSNCSMAHAANSQHFASGQQQPQPKCTAHDIRSLGYVGSGPGNAPGYHLAIQLQPLQSASSSGQGGVQPVAGAVVAGGSGPHSTVPSVGGGAAAGEGAVVTMTTTTAVVAAVVSAVHTTPGGRSWRVLTKKHHTQLRITRGLLIVSTVFVALNLPSYAFRIHAFVIGLNGELYPKDSLHAYIWQEFIQFLYYSNFSSRFFLYSACSRNFRHAVLRLLACRAKRSNYFNRG